MNVRLKYKLENRVSRLSRKHGPMHKSTLAAKDQLAQLTGDTYLPNLRSQTCHMSFAGSWFAGISV